MQPLSAERINVIRHYIDEGGEYCDEHSHHLISELLDTIAAKDAQLARARKWVKRKANAWYCGSPRSQQMVDDFDAAVKGGQDAET